MSNQPEADPLAQLDAFGQAPGAVERDRSVPTGPSFFRVDGKAQFRYVMDASSVIGPRAATDQDKTKHPEAWDEFMRSERAANLDHDHDGKPGGSVPPAVRAKPTAHGSRSR